MVPGTEWNWNSWRNVKFQKDGGGQVSQIRPAGKSKVLDLLNSVTRKARGNSVCVQPSNIDGLSFIFFLKIHILLAVLDTKRISAGNDQPSQDGTFDAPTNDCQRGQCKWSANKGKVGPQNLLKSNDSGVTGSQGSHLPS